MARGRTRDLAAENEELRAELARLRAAAPAADAALASDLAAAIQGLPILVFLFDGDDRFVEYRVGRAGDLYVPPDVFFGRRIDEVLPAPLGARFRELMAQARSSLREQFLDYHLDTPSGAQEFEARVVPLASARVAILATDVTERRRRDEQLRESEARFRLAFASAPIGMAVVGLDERLLDVNDSLCAMLGYARDELLCKTVPEITHPDDVRAEAARKKVLLGGRRAYFRMEKRYLHADGHLVWGQLSVAAVNGPDGQPRYFLGQLEDITDRKEAEERLRSREERFRVLTEKATDVLVLLDTGGRITSWSAGATEALGWTEEEVVQRDPLELLHPEDLATGERLFGRLREPGSEGTPARTTLRVRHRDGSWRVVDTVTRNLLHVPSVQAIVVNGLDVTEQRRLREQFQHAQRLESIGRLAGGVAHDFNNILTVILSCAEQLEADLATAQASAEDVREIRGAAERARDLTRQLLAFARRQVIAPVALDLNALLRDSLKLLARLVGEDVDLSVQLAEGLWPVRCDPAQLQQVVLNLAVNARDAMPRGGKLTLETANVVLDEQYARARDGVAPGPYVQLVVSDSGEGMTDEARAHVFEPFFTTKPPGHGTGLGLATVYGIVSQSGGHVWVYSERGRGTKFEIHLPRLEEGGARAPERPPQPWRAGGRETVLVVEDDPHVREVTVRTLRGAGYEVLEAAGGAAALEAAAGTRVSLLVTDVVMPGMSGREVAEALALREPALRVLYVSGYTQNTIVHHGVLDSGVEFLSKPFTPTALLARVREVLDRR